MLTHYRVVFPKGNTTPPEVSLLEQFKGTVEVLDAIAGEGIFPLKEVGQCTIFF